MGTIPYTDKIPLASNCQAPKVEHTSNQLHNHQHKHRYNHSNSDPTQDPRKHTISQHLQQLATNPHQPHTNDSGALILLTIYILLHHPHPPQFEWEKINHPNTTHHPKPHSNQCTTNSKATNSQKQKTYNNTDTHHTTHT